MLTQAIERLLPKGTQWTIRGDTLAGLEIHSPDVTAPTQAEVDAIVPVIQKERKVASLENIVQLALDAKAKETKWDDMKSARAAAGIPLLGTETATEIAVRDDAVSLARLYLKVWGYAIDEFAKTELDPEVDANYRDLPTEDAWRLEIDGVINPQP